MWIKFNSRVRTKPDQLLEKILLNHIFQKTPYVSVLYSKYLDYQPIPIEKSDYPPSKPDPHARVK